jgi:anti-sigma B factor antagonist
VGKPNLEVVEIGDVTVVTFLNRDLLHDKNINSIGNQLLELVERDNRRKIVLDYSNVERTASAMSGKIISLNKRLHSLGGELAVCNLGTKLYEAYETLQFHRLFRIYKTLEEAIANWGDQLLITCPVQGCAGPVYITKVLALKDLWLRCPECGAQISLRLPVIAPGGESMVEVFTVRLQTYNRQPGEVKNEYMELHRGAPFTLRIIGRLDLFTSAVFEKLWRSVPSPRRLIIDCSKAWDISERGAEVLTRLVTADGEGRVVLVMQKGKLPPPNTFPTDIPIVTDRDKALAALGELPKEAGYPFTVKVTRR